MLLPCPSPLLRRHLADASDVGVAAGVGAARGMALGRHPGVDTSERYPTNVQAAASQIQSLLRGRKDRQETDYKRAFRESFAAPGAL